MAKSRQSIVATAENGKSLVKSIFNLDTDNFEDIHVKSVDRCWESITVIHPDFIEILATELQQLLSKEITMTNLERLVVKSEKLVKIAAKKSEEILCSTLEIIFAEVDYNLSQVVWYHVLFHQRLFYPSCSERYVFFLTLFSEGVQGILKIDIEIKHSIALLKPVGVNGSSLLKLLKAICFL